MSGIKIDIPAPCARGECGHGRRTRGWCDKHYMRWLRHGSTTPQQAWYANPEEAFAARTEWQEDCLVWVGTRCSDGYGRFRAHGRMYGVHRYAWERTHGPIPSKFEIDHTCWNRACVNVAHLRLATRSDNTRNRSHGSSQTGFRGVVKRGARYEARVTHAGKYHFLGLYETAEEASEAASQARRRLFGEFAGGDGVSERG